MKQQILERLARYREVLRCGEWHAQKLRTQARCDELEWVLSLMKEPEKPLAECADCGTVTDEWKEVQKGVIPFGEVADPFELPLKIVCTSCDLPPSALHMPLLRPRWRPLQPLLWNRQPQ